MKGEFYEELRNTSKDYSDRYKNCKLLKDSTSGVSLIATRKIESIPMSANDTYHRVSSHETQRLDRIAADYYKNPLFWWILAQANGIYDPFEPLSPGDIIRIPNIETLYGNGGILL